MIEMDDFMFDQYARNALVSIGLTMNVEIHSKRKLADTLFMIEYIYNGMWRIIAMAIDMGGWFALYLQPQDVHRMYTMPAMQQYTIDHPWIAGV